MQCIAVCRDIWRHDPHLWSSNWPLPADSGQFSELFYANILRKIDFCAQNILGAKVHKFWEAKLI